MANNYDIFISYSRNDKTVVLPYIKQINEVVGKNCWIDLKGIESGVEFKEVIIKAINECKVVLFMLSDSSLRSKWTKREVIYAEDEGKRIVPVLVDGDKLRGWFKFHFGNVDFIDIRSEEQKEKLIGDLRTWLGVEAEEEKRKAEEKVKRKAAAEEEVTHKAEERAEYKVTESDNKVENTNDPKKQANKPEHTADVLKLKPTTKEGKNQNVFYLNAFKAILLVISRMLDFKGKGSLSEFWWNIPLLTFLFLSCLIYSVYIGKGNIIFGSISVMLVFIMSGIYVRRLHDTNRTGWWAFFPVSLFGNCIIPFIPDLVFIPFELCFVSFSFLVLFFCGQDSERKQNLKAFSLATLLVLMIVLIIYVAWACIPFFYKTFHLQVFFLLLLR